MAKPPAAHAAYGVRVGPVLADFSRQHINDDILGALESFANACQLEDAIRAMFAGERVNVTEDRPALHTALRGSDLAGPEVASLVDAEKLRFLRFAKDVRSGAWRGHTGRGIRTVVHIGIGGSYLGPALVCQALAADSDPAIRFVANVDGNALRSALKGLDPATTLFIVVSKSFTTLETRLNAATARSWFIERTGGRDSIARHFVAVTANAEAIAAFGLPEANRFAMWDWVGGRYSLWSAVGLPIAIALGETGFNAMLEGARLADRHFRSAPLKQNLPALMALLQIWNANFLGCGTHAVLVYDHGLRLLPEYLQQLEMESNGKSSRPDGSTVGAHTVPVIWGGEETNGQHSFHQWLHQGTRAFSADLLAVIEPTGGADEHHRWLLANCLAQAQALDGAGPDATRQTPTTTFLLDTLDAYTLGALLALYEHKALCAGTLWGVNPFDQPGVELGKTMAQAVHDDLLELKERQDVDATTQHLAAVIRARSCK